MHLEIRSLAVTVNVSDVVKTEAYQILTQMFVIYLLTNILVIGKTKSTQTMMKTLRKTILQDRTFATRANTIPTISVVEID
jgi:hypothetical protein